MQDEFYEKHLAYSESTVQVKLLNHYLFKKYSNVGVADLLIF